MQQSICTFQHDSFGWKEHFLKLYHWFLDNQRAFPWRKDHTPYRVWVSEIMLQQTRADVVVPYFLHWMKVFPSIQDLANASESTVLKVWEGLGYYRRAKYLILGAQQVVSRFSGVIPDTLEELLTIPGIGKYTAHAILAFAFKKHATPIDGNVLRVMSRLFLIEQSIDLEATRTMLRAFMFTWLPSQHSPILAEALIELGACICKPIPICSQCPLTSICKAARMQQQQFFPKRNVRKKTITLLRWVAVIQYEQQLLLEHRGSEGAMQGLYEFPYEEIASIEELQEKDSLIKRLEEKLSCRLRFVSNLAVQQHMFTHHKVKLFPSFLIAHTKPNGFCCPFVALDMYPFSSGHRRIKHDIMMCAKQHLSVSNEVLYG